MKISIAVLSFFVLCACAQDGPNIKQIESDLMDKLGLKTQIINKKNNKGSVTFNYRDLDQLNHLIEVIKKYY